MGHFFLSSGKTLFSGFIFELLFFYVQSALQWGFACHFAKLCFPILITIGLVHIHLLVAVAGL